MDKKEHKINVVNVPLAVAVDGNAININEVGEVNLIFMQITGKTGDTINAQGVFTARMNLDKVQALRNSLDQALKNHEKKSISKK